MGKRLIKSPNRLQKYGEVFTPPWIVQKILDQPEIKSKINQLNATFLEPSAGEGAFLVELLKRKINRALSLSNNKRQFDKKILIGLSSLYGIELLKDDFDNLIKNMMNEFNYDYINGINALDGKINNKVLKSAEIIIKANILNGNTLKRIDKKGHPLIFSEWNILSGYRVQRTEYTFDSIINGGGPTGETSVNDGEQLNLFDLPDENDNTENLSTRYEIVEITDIYKEKILKD